MCFVSRWYFAVCVSIFGRSKPLPYRHGVPYPPYGGISSRFSVYIIKTTSCISSRFCVDIIASQGASRIVGLGGCVHCIGRSKPLPYRHDVPYPPYGGILSRFSVDIIKTTSCISSHLGVYIIAPQCALCRWLLMCQISCVWRAKIYVQIK